MAKGRSVWGIDIGQCALKAVKLVESGGHMVIDALEVIEHPRVLSEPDIDRSQLIRDALSQFLAKHQIAGEKVAISVSGQSNFTRFVKLPPVEPKRIPSIVRFEAEQQIPFPIDEVIWRWQPFMDPESPDVEVGIFVMKRKDVAEMLAYFNEMGISADYVQMPPLSVYNAVLYDEQLAEQGATLIADIGAEKTELIVADGARIWTRTIQIGGNNFTETLSRAFKLSFAKAEKLKRTAASSKYARQIFQAMRPVFSDLVQEIQRSVGFYTSLHRDTRFKKLVGLGNGFKLPGLQKYLEQNLNIPVARVDSYNNLQVGSSVSSGTFSENVLSLGVAYGLGLQALGKASVDTNLLPDEISRKRRWDRKRPWFATAAAIFLMALSCMAYRATADSRAIKNQENMPATKNIVRELSSQKRDERALTRKTSDCDSEMRKAASIYGHRSFWAELLSAVFTAMDRDTKTASAHRAYLKYARDVESLQVVKRMLSSGNIENVDAKDRKVLEAKLDRLSRSTAGYLKTPRNKRNLIFVESTTSEYINEYKPASTGETSGGFGGGAPASTVAQKETGKPKRVLYLDVQLRTTLSKDRANIAVRNFILKFEGIVRSDRKDRLFSPLEGDEEWWSMRRGIVGEADAETRRRTAAGPGKIAFGPGAAEEEEEEKIGAPDPLIPEEDMSRDQRITVRFKIVIEGDGLKLPSAAQDAKKKVGH